jgi:hypothetical protein
MKALK